MFLPPASPGREMKKAVGQSQEVLRVLMGKVHQSCTPKHASMNSPSC